MFSLVAKPPTFSKVFQFSRFCQLTSKMPSALLILAEGAEEMETVITADVLRRGGIDVTIAGLTGKGAVKCSRNVVIQPDTSLEDVASKNFDVVILPGGNGGAKALAESASAGKVLKTQNEAGKYVAAICAAPIALNSHDIGKGKKLTSHPAVKDTLTSGYQYVGDRVAVDGNVITSQGPGTTFEFALTIVEKLQGKEKRDSLMPPMILPASIS